MIREIADNHGLESIQTTNQANGYPEQLKWAIIGFDSFDEAVEISDEHPNLELQIITKKDGWPLWYRTGSTAYEPLKNDSLDFGDNFSEFEKGISEKDFIDQEITSRIDDGEFSENITDLMSFISEKQELFDEIEDLNDGEIVITQFGEYYDTIQKESVMFSHDTRTTAIALIEV